jgi:hypothetical protein
MLTHRELKGPLHDRFPFDFFAQILYPKTIKDSYMWTFELEEQTQEDPQKLYQDALRLQELAVKSD